MRFTTVTSIGDQQLDALVVPVFKDGDVASAAAGDVRAVAAWVAHEGGAGKLLGVTTHLQPAPAAPDGQPDGTTRMIVVGAGQRAEFDFARAWQVVSAGVRALWQSNARRVGVVLDTGALAPDAAVRSAVEGVLYAMWRPEAYRTAEEDRHLPPIDEVVLITDRRPDDGGADAILRGTAVGEGVNWARAQANEPANRMTPTLLADVARELAAASGLEFEALDEEACAALGMGSFLSVARGSDEPARLIVLRHRGRSGDGYDLGLVGKGITFDSGGISLKEPTDMHLMKFDMAGAASVLAAGGVVARLGLPINLLVVAPSTENLPGAHATKPGDIVTSMSGKTVEVINTDAEGRLVLIDGVTYAQREGAVRVVDVATLTGAIRVALGRHYTGLFGRPAAFVDQIRTAGTRAGERLWPMPLSDEYREDMKSDIADLKNSGGRMGGAILGAAFIDAAVEANTQWAHLDIASTGWFEEDRPFSPKGAQGPMVRTLVELASSIAGRGK